MDTRRCLSVELLVYNPVHVSASKIDHTETVIQIGGVRVVCVCVCVCSVFVGACCALRAICLCVCACVYARDVYVCVCSPAAHVFDRDWYVVMSCWARSLTGWPCS